MINFQPNHYPSAVSHVIGSVVVGQKFYPDKITPEAYLELD